VSLKIATLAAIASINLSAPVAVAGNASVQSRSGVTTEANPSASNPLVQQVRDNRGSRCQRVQRIISLSRPDGRGYDRLLINYVACIGDTPERARERANSTFVIERVLPRPQQRGRPF
jgi:hypothetical protein